MPKKPDSDKTKVGGIRGTGSSERIERAGAVSEVEKAEKTGAVSGVRSVGSAGRTRAAGALTSERREVIHQMIREEADKLFGKGPLSGKSRSVIETAVKMAIDAAIVNEEADGKEHEEDKDNSEKVKRSE